jgi:hypothetical protein
MWQDVHERRGHTYIWKSRNVCDEEVEPADYRNEEGGTVMPRMCVAIAKIDTFFN